MKTGTLSKQMSSQFDRFTFDHLLHIHTKKNTTTYIVHCVSENIHNNHAHLFTTICDYQSYQQHITKLEGIIYECMI